MAENQVKKILVYEDGSRGVQFGHLTVASVNGIPVTEIDCSHVDDKTWNEIQADKHNAESKLSELDKVDSMKEESK